MGQELLQSGYGYLLQMGYYKVGQVLQSGATFLQSGTIITKKTSTLW